MEDKPVCMGINHAIEKRHRMKTTKTILIFCVMLAFAFITAPGALSAQKNEDVEEGTGTDVSNDEELPNGNDQLHRPANTWPKGRFIIITPEQRKLSHLGPTGLWGFSFGQNIMVRRVEPGSPAAGKVMPNDVIYAANGKSFSADRDARFHFANAITESETKQAGGKLVLDILRGGKQVQVHVQLEVMGSFSATSPWNCEKSEKIIANAEDYMRKGLRPESGYPNNDAYMYAPWHDSVLFLMASGNPEMQGLVRRHIRDTLDKLDVWKTGAEVRNGGGFNTDKGWGIPSIKFLFGEYYHRTGDPSVLPYLEMNGFDRATMAANPDAGAQPEPFNGWTWPPNEPTRYGLHPHLHMYDTMGTILSKEAGLEVNEKKLLFDLKYLYVKRAEYGHVRYHGYGNFPIETRQTEAPAEVTEEEKKNGGLSPMNGKPPMAAVMFSLVEGYEKAVEICSTRATYSYNKTQGGHGGIWFNGFWTPIGASKAGPEKFQQFMKGQQWCRELYRNRTGAMWQEGNAKGKFDVLGTGFVTHLTVPRKKLRILGAPRSMFGPSAPAYMKEALAAHRNRDYDLAEHLTRQMIAEGTVPIEDKERVDHFLDSVKTLKESVAYDLKFTEGLLAKQNYALASLELSQLEMVVAPNNPRLKAIAKVVESKGDQIANEIKASKAQIAAANPLANIGSIKKTAEQNYNKELASIQTLIKDSAAYPAPLLWGRQSPNVFYPVFDKSELTQWSLLTIKSMQEAPQGWETMAFDDASWKKATFVSRLQGESYSLLRTSFEVKDVNAFKSLRFRSMANNHRNMTIYLNGEVVAIAADVPRQMTYDLFPSVLELLKPGKNVLAISIEKGAGKENFAFRLDGLKKDTGNGMDDPSGQTGSAKKPDNAAMPKGQPKAGSKPMTSEEEIGFMLAHLKKQQPKMQVGERGFTGLEVHNYLSSYYEKNKSKVTTTDIFLEQVASKSLSGLVYYVVDDKGGKIMLKDWLRQSLASQK